MAQRPTVSVETIEHFDPYFEDNSVRIVDFIVRQISQNDKLQLVERENFDGILTEQERQKNEGFIDGKIVEQGKLSGAQFLYRLNYDEVSLRLDMTLLNVETGEVLCTHTYELKELMQEYNFLPEFWTGLISDVEGCNKEVKNSAPESVFQLVQELDTKSATPLLLVYGEDTRQVSRGDRLTIYQKIKKKLGDKEVDYPEVIGEMTVREVENINFFNAIVIEGQEQLKLLLEQKKDLYARLRY